MTGPDGFEHWVSRSRAEDPPEGFADRVMERVLLLPQPGCTARALPGFVERLLNASAGAAAVFAAALGLGMARNSLTMILVLFAPGRGY